MIIPYTTYIYIQNDNQVTDQISYNLKYGRDYIYSINELKKKLEFDESSPKWNSYLAFAYLGRAMSLRLVNSQRKLLEVDLRSYQRLLQKWEDEGSPIASKPAPPVLRTWDDKSPCRLSPEQTAEMANEFIRLSTSQFEKYRSIAENSPSESIKDRYLLLNAWYKYFIYVLSDKKESSDYQNLLNKCFTLSNFINDSNRESVIDFCECVYRLNEFPINRKNYTTRYNNQDKEVWTNIFTSLPESFPRNLSESYQYINISNRITEFKNELSSIIKIDSSYKIILNRNSFNSRPIFMYLNTIIKTNNSNKQTKLKNALRDIKSKRNFNMMEPVCQIDEINGFSKFRYIGITVKPLPKYNINWVELLKTDIFSKDEKVTLFTDAFIEETLSRDINSGMSAFPVYDDGRFIPLLSNFIDIEKDETLFNNATRTFREEIQKYNIVLEKSRQKPYLTSFAW